MTNPNRGIANRWMNEIWNERRDATIDELMSPDAIGHVEGGDAVGVAPFRAHRTAMLDAFPDLRMTIEDSLADADSVVVRWRINATHRGHGLGIPPTNRPVSFCGMTWFRVSGGRVVEAWESWNTGGLLQSLKT